MSTMSSDELVSSHNQFTVSRYFLAASLVISVYDWLLLSGDESVTIWRTRWTLAKGIYYFNRVVTILGLALATYQLTDLRTSTLSPTFCTVYTFVTGLTQLFSMFLSNLLLTLRLVALYKRKRWVSWFLCTCLVVSYAIAAVLIVVSLRQYGESIGYLPIFHACGSSSTRPPFMPAIFFVPSVFELTIFILTGFRAWRDTKLMTRLSSAPFLTILYRDGIISFFVMFGVRVWNIWIYITQPPASAFMGVYILWAVMTILSTRVYLNLVFLARGPTPLERTEISRVQLDGIKMRIQTTTIGDAGEVINFAEHEGRPPMPLAKFDTVFGIDSVLHGDLGPVWNNGASKEGSESSPPSRRHSSHRPFSSLSFVEPTPGLLLPGEREV